ncbi:hypothetical protein [Kitasatospora sp. NPDC096140]|uniref:RICIN domain-containing protein n=1 Tax=Kitasatospora sp. NPDC096140 TaxID=3155425 RepID=UPI0033287213
MDVLSETFQVDGTIRLNGPSITDQQRWKALLVSGDIGDVKLENRLTGQCISYANTVHPLIVLTPCNGPQTVFEAVPVGGGWVFQSKEVFGDFPGFPGFKVCLEAQPGFGPHFGHVILQDCEVGAPYDPLDIWNAVPIPPD